MLNVIDSLTFSSFQPRKSLRLIRDVVQATHKQSSRRQKASTLEVTDVLEKTTGKKTLRDNQFRSA